MTIAATLRISPAPRDFTLPSADLNSLVTGDLTQPEYRLDSAGNARYLNRGIDVDGNSAVLLNANGAAAGGGGGFYQTTFAPPVGVTSATLSALLSSYTTTTNVKLALYDSGLNTILVSQRVTVLAGTPQRFDLPLPNLTPGATYGVGIVVNDLGQAARLLVWSFAVRPAPAATGLFAGQFVRIRNSALLMGQTSLEPAYFQSWAPQHSRMADVDLETDATAIACECFMGESITFPTDPVRLGYLVNGRPRAFSPSFPIGLSIQETALPLVAGDSSVRALTVRTRPTGLVGMGTWLRALYLPLNCSARLRATSAARTMVIVCDSIGTSSADNHFTSWVAALRGRYPGAVLVHGAPGKQLHDDAANISGAAQTIARAQPSDVWIALGTNDFAFALWNAATFGAAYAQFVDALHAYAPQARIWCQSPLRRSAPASEAANALGDTLSTYRAPIATIANDPSRVPWCHHVDGTGAAFPQAPAIDGIHPDTDQHGQIAGAVCAQLISAGVL